MSHMKLDVKYVWRMKKHNSLKIFLLLFALLLQHGLGIDEPVVDDYIDCSVLDENGDIHDVKIEENSTANNGSSPLLNPAEQGKLSLLHSFTRN